MHYPQESSNLPECRTALPPVSELDGMNLQHRIASPVTRLGRWWLVYSLVLATGGALCVHLLVGSWAAVERYLDPFGLEFGYVLALASAWAVLGWITRKVKRTESVESYRLAYLPLIGCVALALGRLVYSPWGTAVFGLAVAYATWLAYRIALHYGAWMAANPRVDPQDARPYREFARERGTAQCPVRLPVPLETGWVLVLVAYATSVVVGWACAANPFGPGLAVLSFVVVLVLACFALAVRTANDQVGLALGFRLAYRAVLSFLFYNRIACVAPGTFQSPSGLADRRGWQFTRGVVALGVSLPVVTAFFVWVPFAQDEATIRSRVVAYNAVTYDKNKHDRLFGKQDYFPSIVSENRYLPGEVVLTPNERLIYDHLSTPEEKVAYLHRVRYDRHTGLIPNESPSSAPTTADVLSPAPMDDYAGRVTRGVFSGLCSKQALPVWAFIAALVTALVAPVTLVLLVTAVVGWPLLARFYRDLEAPDAALVDPKVSPWERAAAALRTSDHQVASRKPEEGLIREKDHLYLGGTEKGEAPVLAPVSLFNAHFQVVGMSGGGKTALFICPLVTELIRREKPEDKVSILIIDLKGEPLLFNTARKEADRANLPFRYFTNQQVPTYAFNPFTQRHFRKMNRKQRIVTLARGMGVYYGHDYARGHFGSANAQVLRKLLEKHPGANSFARLAKNAEDEKSYQGLTKKAIQDGSHAMAVLQALAGIPALNVAPGDGHPQEVLDNAIDLSNLLRQPQVAYFNLKSDIDEDGACHVARTVLFNMLAAAGMREPGENTPVYLILDEFQQIAGRQIKTVIAQARSRKLHCVLSHQSMSDLKTPDGDFTDEVLNNTNGRVIFSTGSTATLDEMVKLSGIETRQRPKWPLLVDDYLQGNTGPGASATGEILTDSAQEPRLTREHVQHMSAEQTLGFVQLKKNIGYSWFGSAGFIARFRFPITAEEFKDRNQEVWPGGPGTFTPDFDDPPTVGAKSKLPDGPVRPPQTGRQRGRTISPQQADTTTQPTAETDQAVPNEPVDSGSLLDRLAAEPAFGPLPTKPGRKPKPPKKQNPTTQNPADKPPEDSQ